MWYDCQWDNCPQETKMTLKLTTTGHRMAFMHGSAFVTTFSLNGQSYSDLTEQPRE